MKHTLFRMSALIVLLLTLALLVTACGGDKSTDTTTDTPMIEAPTAGVTDTPTQPSETQPETEAETAPPADLTADELKALLSAALAMETGDATITVKTSMGGELLSNQVMTQKGEDFLVENSSEGISERILTVGDTAYYFLSMSDGTSKSELRYVLKLTGEEKEELSALYLGEGASAGIDNAELTEGLLNSTMSGKKYADGRVELTCSGLDSTLVEILMGSPMEGADLTFDFTLDAEGRMTFMRFTVTLSAELTGGEAMTVSSDTAVNYTPAAITAPADAADYVEATYDDLFGFQLPEIDPEEAATLGLPVDGDNYTVGGENPAVSPEEQFYFLYIFAPYYEDKTFTLYGNVTEDEHGNIFVSVGEDMNFAVYFDGVAKPAQGSYVKVTATFTKTVDMGDYVDFDCFTMMATACEVLGEAMGPNGGKLMFITASALNVRSEPDSSKENKVGLLYSGDIVEVLETGLGSNGNWCKITFDCDAGYAYISMTYVSETKP